jgi:hypothetical protein
VTIKDAHELFISQPNVVQLLYSKGGQSTRNVTAKSCMEACLRMKPDSFDDDDRRRRAYQGACGPTLITGIDFDPGRHSGQEAGYATASDSAWKRTAIW